MADPSLPPWPDDGWGRWRRFRSPTGRDLWVRPSHLVEVHPAIEVYSERDAVELFDGWAFDEQVAWDLLALHEQEWGPPDDLDPHRARERVLGRLRSAFESGALRVHVERLRDGAPGTTPVQPAKPARPPGDVGPVTTWIEVALRDEDDRPIVDEPVELIDAGGGRFPRRTDQDGLVRVDRLEAGTCELRFPRMDGREWERRRRPFPEGTDAVREVHVVGARQCMAWIANRHGFRAASTLYDHPRNAALRRERPDPDLLWPGDEVQILVGEERFDEIATGARHPYWARSASRWLRVVLHDADGAPLADVEATVLLSGGRNVVRTTNGNGLLEAPVPPDADRAVVVTAHYQWPLDLANVRPISGSPDEGRSGAWRRLANLGSHARPAGRAGAQGGAAGGVAGRRDDFDAVVWDFQSRHGLEPTGRLDEATVAAVIAAYGH